jgi:hypothetical protein
MILVSLFMPFLSMFFYVWFAFSFHHYIYKQSSG